jgi:hypothetical protein
VLIATVRQQGAINRFGTDSSTARDMCEQCVFLAVNRMTVVCDDVKNKRDELAPSCTLNPCADTTKARRSISPLPCKIQRSGLLKPQHNSGISLRHEVDIGLGETFFAQCLEKRFEAVWVQRICRLSKIARKNA